MKIKYGSIFAGSCGAEEEKEILELTHISLPDTNSKLSFEKIEEKVGWININAKINESEFVIAYSSCMFDTSALIEFFADIITTTEDIVLFLDNEGSYPIFYAEPFDNDNIRFLFAHDYELFTNTDIDDLKSGKSYTPKYKCECGHLLKKLPTKKQEHLHCAKCGTEMVEDHESQLFWD
ncbi:hypothetical protein J6S88_00075 [bacterium]|nr:hypothetical protein [bacterium]